MSWLDLAVFIFGLLSGSLINCLAWRLPRGENILWTRSRCPWCQKVLGALELVPVFSFLLQKARCRGCGKKISWQYPGVELATGVVFWLFYRFGPAPIEDYLQVCLAGASWSLLLVAIAGLVLSWLILASLILIFLIDLRKGIILDVTVWPLAVLLLLMEIFYGELLIALIAGVGTASFFGLQYLVSRGRWIGAGDIGLGFLLGVLLSWPLILLTLFLAYVGGAVISLLLLVLKKKKFTETVPLGAFLIPAALVTLMWGNEIIIWFVAYFNL